MDRLSFSAQRIRTAYSCPFFVYGDGLCKVTAHYFIGPRRGQIYLCVKMLLMLSILLCDVVKSGRYNARQKSRRWAVLCVLLIVGIYC